jgi:hypothetical protein
MRDGTHRGIVRSHPPRQGNEADMVYGGGFRQCVKGGSNLQLRNQLFVH